ncbi:hypothetical protein O9570_17145 [Achromobacter xylosoxidans]|jgi:hypothetical protein|uniref:Uncharacterized protein n=1 Tax=Alcaligenes xylosoxydans xylosoxydans TaxID=85698 RepID=A0A9X3KZN4_ALCXX|nr:hypothetical protein [Achromobacter xylosoxidans]MCZ8403182.1 hypothetical protein [Achromobacter xylosoxidans]
MKSLSAALLLLMSAGVSNAAPTYEVANGWANDFSQAISSSPMALTKPAEYRKHAQNLAALAARAEKLFGRLDYVDGPLARCTSSANYYQQTWQFQTSPLISNKGMTPQDLSRIADMAFAAGQDYRSCRDSIHDLEDKPGAK